MKCTWHSHLTQGDGLMGSKLALTRGCPSCSAIEKIQALIQFCSSTHCHKLHPSNASVKENCSFSTEDGWFLFIRRSMTAMPFSASGNFAANIACPILTLVVGQAGSGV